MSKDKQAGKGGDRRAYSVKKYDKRRAGIKWPSDKKAKKKVDGKAAV